MPTRSYRTLNKSFQEKETLAGKIRRRQDLMEQDRITYEGLQDEAVRLSMPGRGGLGDDDNKGAKLGSGVYDGTAIDALDMWANGFQGYLSSPAYPWFKFTLPGDILDRSRRLKLWLEDLERYTYPGLRKSNFYTQYNPWLRDGGSWGTSAMTVENDARRGATSIYIPHPRENYFTFDKFGNLVSYHRKFPMTAEEAITEFGKDRFSETFRMASSKDPFGLHEFLYVTYHAESVDLAQEWPALMRRRKFVTAYVLNEQDGPESVEDGLLRQSAADSENPIVWRPRFNSGEIYGRSPAMDAIVAINRAEASGKDMTDASHLSVYRPFLAPQGLKGKISLKPFGGTYYKGSLEENQIYPWMDIKYPWGIDREERLQAAVQRFFHTRFFTMLFEGGYGAEDAGPKVYTATQILAMQGSRAVLAGPSLLSLNDANDRFFERYLQVEFSAGRLPPPPDEFWEYTGGEFDIDYLGPISQAQKRLFRQMGIDAAIEKVMPLYEIYPEEIRAKINGLELIDEILDSAGLPEKIQYSNEEAIETMMRNAAERSRAMRAQIENLEADTDQKEANAIGALAQ